MLDDHGMPASHPEESSGAATYLAAFGKHPGWDDHIDDLGIETALLAAIKRDLYVNGIGSQLDAGAWEKLSDEQRFDGFHHDFVWVTGGQAVAGHMWASRDGKGRSKYPMVVAAQCTGGSIPRFLSWVQPLLDNLEDHCRDTMDADGVRSAVDLARERLRAAANVDPSAPPLPSWAVTTTAIADIVQELDADNWRQAFHRLLHRLAPRLVDTSTPAADAEPVQVRIPLHGDAPLQSMVLWLAAFRLLVGAATSVLLVRPLDAACIDIIVGDPVAPQLYCLLASQKAIPLTTDIPFAISSDTADAADALVDGWRRNPTHLLEALALAGPEPKGWSRKLKTLLRAPWKAGRSDTQEQR